jgi:hypothetical protein
VASPRKLQNPWINSSTANLMMSSSFGIPQPNPETIFRRIRDGIKRKIEEFLKSESSEIPDAIASFKL